MTNLGMVKSLVSLETHLTQRVFCCPGVSQFKIIGIKDPQWIGRTRCEFRGSYAHPNAIVGF